MHNLFILNVKQHFSGAEKSIVALTISYLSAQGFLSGKGYWQQGKAIQFEIGGLYKRIFQTVLDVPDHACPESIRELKICDPDRSAIHQFAGEPKIWNLLNRLAQYEDYHDLKYHGNLHRLEIGDWLVAVDYHL